MFTSKAFTWSLLCALLCLQCVLGAHLPRESLLEHEASSKTQPHHEPRANPIIRANTSPSPPLPPPPPSTPRSIGIHVNPLTKPMLPQAVGQLLIQAIFTAFNEFGSRPGEYSNSFQHSVSSQLPTFDVAFEMSAKGNQTGDYRLTNSRIVETLSLLGFDYSNQQNVSSLVEYNFDVVIDVWDQPEVIIATGSVKNVAHHKPGTNLVSTA